MDSYAFSLKMNNLKSTSGFKFDLPYYSHIIKTVDCFWGDWKDWGSCSASCGGGMRTRERDETINACPGIPCTGSNNQDEPCNEGCCPGW